MPAPIIVKSQAQIDVLRGYIGGSSGRGEDFALHGAMRQLILTEPLSTNSYNCLGSCDVGIFSDSSVSGFTTFYNPAKRLFEFRSSTDPDEPPGDREYTEFMGTLVFSDSGFLPPEEQDESWRVSVQVFDEEGPGNFSEINIYGRLTQFRPVIDLNGREENGTNYTVSFREGEDMSVPIVDDGVFIADEDIDFLIVSVTVSIANPQLDTSQEFLSLSQATPEDIEITGENTNTVILSASDPSPSNTSSLFVAFLLRLRYTNTADEPLGVTRLITFTISDGVLANDPLAVTTIAVEAVNDAPVVDLNGDEEGMSVVVEYTEGDPPTLISPSATLQDADSPILTELTIDFTPFDVGDESLAVDLPSESSITCNLSPCNGTSLMLSGIGDREVYQSLLRTLAYVNVKQPRDIPNFGDRIVTARVRDEESLSESGTEILIHFLAIQSRVIVQLDAPNWNYFTEYAEGQSSDISVVGDITISSTSVQTLQSVEITIRDNLPGARS
jgi:hypothetical protein